MSLEVAISSAQEYLYSPAAAICFSVIALCRILAGNPSASVSRPGTQAPATALHRLPGRHEYKVNGASPSKEPCSVERRGSGELPDIEPPIAPNFKDAFTKAQSRGRILLE